MSKCIVKVLFGSEKGRKIHSPAAACAPIFMRFEHLMRRTSAKTMLDYGSGKGALYRQKNIKLKSGEIISSVAEYLSADFIACFDPGVPEYSEFPPGQFDAVVSTDVLEHCPEEDIPWIVGEMFAKARKFVFANVASYPADKILPNGENAHCTQNSPNWWAEILKETSASYPGVLYQFDITQKHRGMFNKITGRRWVITPITNFHGG